MCSTVTEVWNHGQRILQFRGKIREILAAGGRILLSGLLSATYEFHEGDEFIRTAADAIFNAPEFLNGMKNLS